MSNIGQTFVVGKKEDGSDLIVDWEANTSGVVIGASGSGKTVAVQDWVKQLAEHGEDEAKIVVIDPQDSYDWKTLSNNSSNITVNSNINNVIALLNDIIEEWDVRANFLKENNFEDVKQARIVLKTRIEDGDVSAKELLAQIPILTVVIEKMSFLMANFKENNKDSYNLLRKLLCEITAKGRFAGIHLLLTSQRSIDTSIPKDVLANSSFKFVMKTDVESDARIVLGRDIEGVKLPKKVGEGLLYAMDVEGIPFIHYGKEVIYDSNGGRIFD